MKNKLGISGISGLAALLLISSFAFAEMQDPKKARHIKLTKTENGKTMHLDTMLMNDEVLIWNGDTINPPTHTGRYSPSEFDRLHNTDKMDQQKRIRIYKNRAGQKGDFLIMHPDSGEDFGMFTEKGDSVGKKIMIHKRLKNGPGKDHFIYFNERNGHEFAPMPPMPPVPHIQRFRGNQSERGINLNDPNVISYKKKDIGGDREKIEIIRKKTKETQEFDFDSNFMIDVPAPPAPPLMDEKEMIKQEKKMEKEKQKSDKKNNTQNDQESSE